MDCICTYGGIPKMDKEDTTYIGGKSELVHVPRNTTFEEFIKMMEGICLNDQKDFSVKHFVVGLVHVIDEESYETLFVFVKRNPQYNPLKIWIVKHNNPSYHEPNPSSLIQRWDTSTKDLLDISQTEEEHIVIEKEVVDSNIPSAEKNIKIVLEWLGEEDVHNIGIKGADGIGKTWTAKQVTMRVAASDNPYDIVIWVNVCEYHTTIIQLQMQIADQLNLLSNTNDDDKPEATEENMRQMIFESLANKRFLLILDELQHFLTLINFQKEQLRLLFPSQQNRSSKVIFIGRVYDFGFITMQRVLSMDALPENEAWLLFREKAGLEKDSPVLQELAKPLLEKCKGMPLKIITVAGVLRKFEAGTSLTWEAKLRHVVDLMSTLDWKGFLYEILPSKVMKDCFVYSTLYMQYHRIRVKDLITSWILEGLLDGFNCLENAYEKGLYLLKELMDRYLLYELDEDHVTMHQDLWPGWAHVTKDGSTMKLIHIPMRPDLFENKIEQERFRTISLMNESMQTKYSNDDALDFTSMSILLIHGDGGHPLGDLKDKFFEQVRELQTLAVLHAEIVSFPTSFFNLENLRVLLLRDSGSPKNLIYIQGLQNLEVLSLSGASTLKNLPDEFFEHLLELKSLDLSRTQLKCLPESITKIPSICRLVLRDCSYLETVPYLKSLMMLDLMGASALRTIADDFLSENSELQQLDLSGTLVNLSTVSVLGIQHLTVRDCSRIVTLPCPAANTVARVLDLSGASAFKGFQDETPESRTTLELINLSETQIIRLPFLSECRALRKLILRNCFSIEELSFLPYELEVLDLSGSTAFRKFKDDEFYLGLQSLDLSRTQVVSLPSLSVCYNLCQLLLADCLCLEEIKESAFGNLSGLQTLNLSGTQLEKLPDLSKCSSLQRLLLRDCSNLKKLPHLMQLERLQVLDLSGATAISQPEDEYFQNNFELQKLNLSRILQIVHLPSLSKCSNLRKLVLRGCSRLKTLPTLEALTRLKILDLSGATSFTAFQDDSFGEITALKILNLSETEIVELPLLTGCLNLRRLLLRGCSKLATLPHLKPLTRLQVLDLSGASGFKEIDEEWFKNNCELRQLNLSRNPHIVKLPSLSKCQNLSELILSGCSKLSTLPHLEALKRLKVIDLSGATSFTEFQEVSFGQMYELQILDLSETRITEVPLLSGCINLRQLLLRGCLRIQALPHLKALTKLEVLDLSGCTAFTQLQDECFEQNNVLRVLDLSRTEVTEFSFLSRCNNLRQLSLQRCLNVDELSFEGLYLLQKVDLSETQIKKLPSSISVLKNLRHLKLNDCSNLATLPHLEVFTKIEVLDLSGTKIIEFPHGISECIHLTCFSMQNRKYFWLYEWENRMKVEKELNWGQCNGSKSSGEVSDITPSDTDIIHFVEKNFLSFHLCLTSLQEWGKEDDFHLQGKEVVFSDKYYQSTQLPESKEPNKFLKLCGFQSFPNGTLEVICCHVEILYLKKNAFITRLSDVGAENIKVMKECWIEKCDNMKSIFYDEEEEENVSLGRNLQGLWVSNNSKLRSLYQGELQSMSFTCLRHLYIDCCPSLITIFSSGTGLENLETLVVKFCVNFESVFGLALGEQTLPNLQKLTLWKLPALHSICGGVLPSSLQILSVKGCPNLRKLPLDSTNCSMKINGEQQWWDQLESEKFSPSPHCLVIYSLELTKSFMGVGIISLFVCLFFASSSWFSNHPAPSWLYPNAILL